MVKLLTKKQIHSFFTTLQKNNPSPTTELVYTSTFELLIAVILSAQATDKSVNKATKALFKKAKNAQEFIDIGESQLKKYIKIIGLYNTKAQNIIKTCTILQTEHNGQVPDDRKSLESLPGVGRKTANVILNTAFGHKTIAVDTHIFRVSNRTGLAPANNVLAVEKKLLQRIPDKFMDNAHHWLILHGRYICTARTPKCQTCLVFENCTYNLKEYVS